MMQLWAILVVHMLHVIEKWLHKIVPYDTISSSDQKLLLLPYT
jgi:hypothetical protein